MWYRLKNLASGKKTNEPKLGFEFLFDANT